MARQMSATARRWKADEGNRFGHAGSSQAIREVARGIGLVHPDDRPGEGAQPCPHVWRRLVAEQIGDPIRAKSRDLVHQPGQPGQLQGGPIADGRHARARKARSDPRQGRKRYQRIADGGWPND
jgi:hypothetical protein